jgi:hypothetical protein
MEVKRHPLTLTQTEVSRHLHDPTAVCVWELLVGSLQDEHLCLSKGTVENGGVEILFRPENYYFLFSKFRFGFPLFHPVSNAWDYYLLSIMIILVRREAAARVVT